MRICTEGSGRVKDGRSSRTSRITIQFCSGSRSKLSFFRLGREGAKRSGIGSNCSIKKFKIFLMKPTKEGHIEVEGVVSVVLPGTMFRVELDNKHMVLATICGKMRKRWVRLTAGDRVKMEMSPYDLNKGRITWRLR